MLLNLCFPNLQNGGCKGDKLPRRLAARNEEKLHHQFFSYSDAQENRNIRKPGAYLELAPVAATAGATGKWGLTNDKQQKGPTPWDGGSGSSEKRRSQTLDLKNEN